MPASAGSEARISRSVALVAAIFARPGLALNRSGPSVRVNWRAAAAIAAHEYNQTASRSPTRCQ
jgi:hypothetical protein